MTIRNTPIYAPSFVSGGLGIFLGFLPCSPHCKPEVQEEKELNGDYDFYRPIIRIESA